MMIFGDDLTCINVRNFCDNKMTIVTLNESQGTRIIIKIIHVTIDIYSFNVLLNEIGGVL